jgi:predicted SnoaL-like aldol condensation-catalyzing enzyme
MKFFKAVAIGAALAVAMSGPVFAQAKTMTAQEQANLKLVLDWWREVLQAGHTELAPKYMAEDYIQHNPNISTGRDAFVKVFSARAPREIQPTLNNPPVVQFAKGDYVALIWEREGKDPVDPSKSYKYNFFDVVRVKDGKVQEHWDSVEKNPPREGQPVVPVITGVGPPPVSPKNTPEEDKNLAIANVEFHDILEYGHVELAEKVMAEGYIQHNPNVPSGRQGFVDFFSKFRKPEPLKPEWKRPAALTLVSGNMVLMMFDRVSKDPADPTKDYKWNWFDMVRVDGGMIQEHWDQAVKNPPRPPAPAG